MRRAGEVVAEMHEVCTRAAVPGATTLEVDAAAREVIAKRGARSNFLGYHGFPAVVCTSPNEVVVHGIPSADIVLREGDILSIDCGAIIVGTAQTEVLDDGWTVVTLDGRRSAHFEHTIAVTDHGPEVLTLPR